MVDREGTGLAGVDGLTAIGFDKIEPNARGAIRAYRNLGYKLNDALADLIDNSIDAKAKHVLIRFIYTPDRDERFAPERLFMLGVKSTCKDRWRQILSEADRIRVKHLFTLEPGISPSQTDEMRARDVALVVPAPLHGSFSQGQREDIKTLAEFLQLLRDSQR